MMDKCDSLGISYNDNITELGILQEDHNVNIVKNEIFNFNIPDGYIIEYGSWRGAVIDLLAKEYGEDRVFGFDISNFTNHPRIHKMDVRHLAGNKKYKLPIALAWNDLSEWEGSPLGKQAAFDHALNNLVDNGIYMEMKNSPDYIRQHPNLHLFKETKYVSFFRFLS